MGKKFENPFGPKTAMNKVLSALVRTRKPLMAEEVARRAKVPLRTTKNMLAAMVNRYHNAPMIRVGICLTRSEDGYAVERCEPDPEAKRPERKVKQ